MFGFGSGRKKDRAASSGLDKEETRPGFVSPNGTTALVTGSSGMCGARLVEMLLERGTTHVIAFDRAAPDEVLQKRFDDIQQATGNKITIFSGAQGDLTSPTAVENAFKAAPKIDICYHIAALVGPFHEHHMYKAVNLDGTIRIIEMCKIYKVNKLVYSSSPSTRFHGTDVTGQTEDELSFPNKYLATYAETKALGEMEVSKACCPELLTISVAPHQVYGPFDSLFLPNLLETAGNGRLRIFGKGQNKISVCFVDNYAHGLMCGADALYEGSPALAKFYIVTDSEPQLFWKMINKAIVAMGFTDLNAKFHLPVWLLYGVAYVANVIGWIIGKKFKLNPFNVKMLIIHRYFSIANAKRDLKYEPIKDFDEAWPMTIEWFKTNWLPGFLQAKQLGGSGKKSD